MWYIREYFSEQFISPFFKNIYIFIFSSGTFYSSKYSGGNKIREGFGSEGEVSFPQPGRQKPLFSASSPLGCISHVAVVVVVVSRGNPAAPRSFNLAPLTGGMEYDPRTHLRYGLEQT